MDRIQKNLCETHVLGPATREWLVSNREIPTFRATHTRVAGYSDARHGYEFVRIQPEFGQVLACIEGEGEVLIDGVWHRCPSGCVYLTAPRALCAYHVRPGKRWRVCWVIYEEAEQLPELESGRASRLVVAHTAGLHLAIEGICREVGAGADSGVLEQWASLVHRQVLRILKPDDGEPRLNRLWAVVWQDLGGDWSLERMARCAGVSSESLRRLCQQYVGRSPLAHVTHLRMQFAADLLSCSREKIASVARRVGYSDEFAFSNAFKRTLGMPPSRYRARA